MRDKSIYTNTNVNNNTAEIRNTGFQQDPNSTFDNFNQNLINIQQHSNLTNSNLSNIMNHQNIYNDNMQINTQNKNIQINNFNNSISKGNQIIHLMNSPKMKNQSNMNVNNFVRTGKIF